MSANPNKFSKFWQELKRRRVVHVIIVYATAAFVIIELVNNITEPLRLPEWTPTFAIIVLVIGFPLALIFSWIFDVTPEGIARTKPVEEVQDIDAADKQNNKKRRIYWGRVINLGITGILIVAVVTYLIIHYDIFSEPNTLYRFSVNLPDGDKFGSSADGSLIAISNDGKKLIYVGEREGTSQLFLRSMDEYEALPISGTVGASSPFFSPDGKWACFYLNGNLCKVSLLGGYPQVICEAKDGQGGTWVNDTTIIFTDSNTRSLYKVSPMGGLPVQITSALKYTTEGDERSHLWPNALPGGKEFLYTIYHGSDAQTIAIYSLETGKKWDLFEPGSSAQYINTGYIIYTWKGDILAAPFNIGKKKLTGDPIMIFKGVKSTSSGCANYSVSDDGSLVYIPGIYEERVLELVFVNLEGDIEYLNFPKKRSYQSPRISPNGESLLITNIEDNANLWVFGLDRGTTRRFTDKEFNSFWGIWSPDGEEIVFNSNLHGGTELNLYKKMSDGSGKEKRLTTSSYHQLPKCWSKDGKLLLYKEAVHPETGVDIFMRQMEGDTIPVPLMNRKYNETHPLISPNGKWLAFVSDESGKEEVFVCKFPDLGGVVQISANGGTEPLWAPNENVIYYRDYTGDKVYVVPFTINPDFDAKKPVLLFEKSLAGSSGPWGRNYDITPNGNKFLMIKETLVENNEHQINVVLNWNEELEALFNNRK